MVWVRLELYVCPGKIPGRKVLKCLAYGRAKQLKEQASHTVHFGTISDKEGKAIDEVLVTLFKKGKSFTGEESAEISCHGSLFIHFLRIFIFSEIQ